jgi:hypothetical protein
MNSEVQIRDDLAVLVGTRVVARIHPDEAFSLAARLLRVGTRQIAAEAGCEQLFSGTAAGTRVAGRPGKAPRGP